MPPTILSLLRDAHNAARFNLPLRYHGRGFYDPRRNEKLRVHSFQTVAAAEKRGLVMTTGQAPHRILHITGTGLSAVLKSEKRRGR